MAFFVFLRMPEHPEHERAGRVFYRLHRVVFGSAGNDQPVPDLAHPLVVVGLYGRPLGADGAGGEGVGCESDLVVGEGAGGVAVLLVAEHVGEVLLQAAAVGDVQDVHPAADA